MSEFKTFNFKREEVIKECERMVTLEEQLRYLRFVLKEKYNQPTELDYNINIKPTFEDFIRAEIEYREYLLKLPEKNQTGLVKIKGKTVDIVRIFEAMMDAKIISSKTEIPQLAKIFFVEPLEGKKFVDQYYARKDEINDIGRNSNSRELVDFVKKLIEKSFSKKEKILDELAEHILQLNKNSSY